MRIIHRQIGAALETFLRAGDGPYHLVSPFISTGLLESLLRRHPVQTVYTSWRPDHLLSGYSSLDVYPLVRSFGISLITCDQLHAKVVTNQNFSRALIGSANLTRRGLGIAADSNLEMSVIVEYGTDEVRAFLSAVMTAGQIVDDEAYMAYQEWLKEHDDKRISPWRLEGPKLSARPNGPWLLALLPASPSPRALWDAVNRAQAADSATIHDLTLLGGDLTGSVEEATERMRNALARNPFFQHILDEICRSDTGIHFGRMKQIVQSRAANVPPPHRRDLTEVVQNQYRWIVDLYPMRFEVVRPNWSEVIRLRK